MGIKKRAVAGMVIFAAAVAAVAIGRRSPALADGVPAYRRQGPAGAPVVITEYSDFQCPKCALAQPDLKALLERYDGKVRLVFRHFPLKMHKWSEPAARAAEAAGLQGKFWEYAEKLYAGQKDWAEAADPTPVFDRYGTELGLDAARFAADRDGEKVRTIIAAERAHAESVPIMATPTFYVNERVLVGDSQLAGMGVRVMESELAR